MGPSRGRLSILTPGREHVHTEHRSSMRVGVAASLGTGTNCGKLCPEATVNPAICKADSTPTWVGLAALASPVDSHPPLFTAGSRRPQEGSLILTVLPPSEGHREMAPAQTSPAHLCHSPLCPFCPAVRLGSGLAPCSVAFEAIHGLGRWGRWKQVTSSGHTAIGSNRMPWSNLLRTGQQA